MAKKVVDIFSPRFSPGPTPSQKKKGKPFPLRRKASWRLVLLVLIIIGIFAYFTLPRAEIEIWPETEIVTFEAKSKADTKVENIDLLAKLIPGISFEKEKTLSREFPSTGRKLIEERAEGIIRVFNHSPREQILIARTRFQPPLRKFQPPLEEGETPWFRTTERIVIPPRGYVDVRVVADVPGEKYNIESSIFVVPGLAGTPQYTLVYGKSFESMKGGLRKEVTVVTQEDLEKAERVLKEKARKETKRALENKIPPEFIFLSEATKAEILELFSLAQAGSELEEFIFQVRAKATTISFRKEDLENFAKEFIIFKIPADKRIDRESLRITYSPKDIDFEAGKILLSFNLEARIYSDIDKLSLKQKLFGKSLVEAQSFLQNQPDIKRAEVKLWPFWVRQVPRPLEKIRLEITLD